MNDRYLLFFFSHVLSVYRVCGYDSSSVNADASSTRKIEQIEGQITLIHIFDFFSPQSVVLYIVFFVNYVNHLLVTFDCKIRIFLCFCFNLSLWL